ncbi:MAG: DUF2461 domain-containing protein [Christensenellaceae bacterium]|nr:DUF2461 domain-containing protein [Christensenellaceae bacterium]
MEAAFAGFTEDTYKFLIELAFNNNKPFFEENRARYKESVQKPMLQLAEALLPTVLAIDSDINPRTANIVSRIYRDTRFSQNKMPYRDHAWLAFRRPGNRLSEGFTMYFEITPQSYGYGLGMYNENIEMMNALRAHALADPARFLSIVEAKPLQKFVLEGPEYKKDRVPEAPLALKSYLNHKGLSWCYSCDTLAPTLSPELFDEVRRAFEAFAPLYHFVMDM